MGGLAMQMIGPLNNPCLLLNAFVVGSRVSDPFRSGQHFDSSDRTASSAAGRKMESFPDWFLKPHRRLRHQCRSESCYLITGLQLFTIIVSRGDVILLGEAYAFGVIWSFVFKTLSMVILRFKDRSRREFKVPFNVRIGNVELPIGLGLIFPDRLPVGHGESPRRSQWRRSAAWSSPQRSCHRS